MIERRRLYLIEILHQTTTSDVAIPPGATLYLIEILHQTTTCSLFKLKMFVLYLIEILHQTTTGDGPLFRFERCILSKFYIKPQQLNWEKEVPVVVSYRNSTSNHNNARRQWRFQQLYLIEILHQTTTSRILLSHAICCILSKFYIKPQLIGVLVIKLPVVSYRNSTSNHNSGGSSIAPGGLYLIEILHQTTTSTQLLWLLSGCILSKFYIKPQPGNGYPVASLGCILSKFYIKPQLEAVGQFEKISCILSKFYIKPQQCRGHSSSASGCILSKFYIKPQRRASY